MEHINDLGSYLSQIDPRQVEQARQASAPTVFTKDDLRGITSPLALIARMFIIQAGITKEIFTQRHLEESQRTFMAANKINYERNNTLRSLTNDKVTYDLLEKVIRCCGYDVADVAITVVNREDGTTMTIKKSDALDMIRDNPFHPSVDISRVTGVTE